jgi:hypothetical protein
MPARAERIYSRRREFGRSVRNVLLEIRKRVFIIIRNGSSSSSMSQYLIEQISRTENILSVQKRGSQSNRKGGSEGISDRGSGYRREKNGGNSVIVHIHRYAPFTDWIKLDLIKMKKGL